MYYLIDKSTKKVIMALPSKEHITFLKGVYQDWGTECFVSHLMLVLNEEESDNEQVTVRAAL